MMSLTTDQINQIVSDVLTDKPPRISSVEADDLRQEIASDIAKAKSRGWVIDLPSDISVDTNSSKGEWQPIENVFCPTGSGGGVDPSCSLSGSGIVSRSITDKESAAYGGRPANPIELKSVYHTTSAASALKILSGPGIYSANTVMGSKAVEEIMGGEGLKDYGDWIYCGLNREASIKNAVAYGVTLTINARPYLDKAVVQEEQEGGIVLIHKHIPVSAIKAISFGSGVLNTTEGKAILKRWKELNRVGGIYEHKQ